MRALITGAGGFTGRYLAAELAHAGYEVIGLFAEPPRATPPNISSVLVCNLLDSTRVLEVVRASSPDVAAHLAAISFVGHGNVDEIYLTNVLGTRHLLEALSTGPTPPRMTLLASSANIYGNALPDVLDESTPPAPANDYAVSKLAMEHMAKLYSVRTPTVIVRPFNYTGVGQGENFLLPKIVSHVRRRAPVIELGNLDVARDFSDVRTVVQYYRRLLESRGVAGRTLNVCSGQTHSLADVLSIAQEIAGHHLEVRIDPAYVRNNDVKTLKGSRAQLDKFVPDVAPIPLKETLRWMIENQT